MKTLICGASGFIGGALALNLSGAVDVSMGRAHADLTTAEGWKTALENKPELVYMCAGKTGGSGLDPLHFVTDNALMALHMYRECEAAGVKRIVYLSSTTGYPEFAEDGRERMFEDDYFAGEPHPAYFNPGHTKRFIERLGAMWAHKIETVFIRVGGVYGPGADFDPQSSHVIEATIRKVAEKQDPIILWGDGSNERDALYIDDLVDALVRSLAWQAGAYNLGTGLTMSVNSMLHTLLAHSGHQCRVERDLSKPAMIQARKLDMNKAWATGWHARTMMPQGIVKTYEWFTSGSGQLPSESNPLANRP